MPRGAANRDGDGKEKRLLVLQQPCMSHPVPSPLAEGLACPSSNVPTTQKPMQKWLCSWGETPCDPFL